VFALAVLALLSGLFIWVKCTQVLFGNFQQDCSLVHRLSSRVFAESVIVIDRHGIQFETHRGFPPFPLIVSRRFIPTTSLQDFIINEGLRRWDVRYYLAAIKRSHVDDDTLEVAYEVRALLYQLACFV
jgi:phosphatidylinositol N-acetylglucosaminyltransferase subunit H